MVATTRRRHKAEGDSPLRALNTPKRPQRPQRPPRMRAPKTKQASPVHAEPEFIAGTSEDPGEGIFFREPPISLQNQDAIIDDLLTRIRELEDAEMASEKALYNFRQETDALRKENETLRRQNAELKASASSKQINGNGIVVYDDCIIPQPIGAIQGTPAAIELLRAIEDNAKVIAPRVETPNREAQRPRSPEGQVAQPADEDELFASPHSPDAKTPFTPTPSTKRASTFGFSKLWSTLSSAFTPSRPTAQAAASDVLAQGSVQASDIVDEIAMSLTPTPPVMRDTRKQPKKKRTKGHRQAMIKKIANSVNDPDEKAKAEAWAKSVFTQLPKDAGTLGDKRKRLEHGVKVGDLKKVQGTKPWKSGSYGLDDDIFDLSDDEDAPAWAVLQEMLLEEQANQPPAKKHKADHEVVTDDDVTPLNETLIPTPEKSSPLAVVNSSGHSASLSDMQPRSSILPSPMFESPATHREGGNVFRELQGHEAQAEERAALKRSLQKTPTKQNCFGSFTVPDSDSEEDDVNDASASDASPPVWTQQPPPAPVPAHASLPTPLTESAVAAEASASKTVDPVEFQRAKITKHTPAKPSRLREMYVPSPSLKSDSGEITMMTGSPFGESVRAAELRNDIQLLSQSQWIDIPEGMEKSIEDYIRSGKFAADVASMRWTPPDVSYDDEMDYQMES